MHLPKIKAVTAIICLFSLIASTAGCSINSETGNSDFIVLSKAREDQIGKDEHPKIIKQFGGVYKKHDISAYVAVIGGKLAAVTERPDITFTFTVLDSQIVNAFTTPGGYIYITRGLIALANTEAQLASVIGHELGHAIARHSAQRLSQATLTQFGLSILGQVAGTPVLNDIVGRLAGLYLKAFSREQEFEADMLGVRYLARAGYDPLAASEFLTKLRDHSQLQAKLAGGTPETIEKFDIAATHPRTAKRMERAIAAANAVPASDAVVGRTKYLAAIDGMIYGDSADEGFIDGERFSHRNLRFEFIVPVGFVLTNRPAQVIASSKRENTVIIFDQAPDEFIGNMTTYLDQNWITDLEVDDLETIFINGMEASTGWMRQNANGKTTIVRFVAIRFTPQIIYRFVLLMPSPSPSRLITALKRTTYSFRRLTEEEAIALSEKRVRVVHVEIGDTIETLAKRMVYRDFQRERFEVLNGLSNGSKIFVGESVKIISH